MGFELSRHFGSLMRWFNSTIPHRWFILLLENDILISPSKKILSYEQRDNMYVIFEFQRVKLVHFEKRAYKYHFENYEVSFDGKISIKVLSR